MKQPKVTEWFDRRYKPRYNGAYEVMLTHWPWPVLLKWNNETGWANNDFIKWRGLNYAVAFWNR